MKTYEIIYTDPEGVVMARWCKEKDLETIKRTIERSGDEILEIRENFQKKGVDKTPLTCYNKT